MLTALSLFKKFTNLILPLTCIRCGDIIHSQTPGLCPPCWARVPFFTKPYCRCCGLPFSFDIEEETLCGGCHKSPPSFKTARSVFAYTPETRDLILRFKHMDNLNPVPMFAKWMGQVSEKIENPLCIPVPLYWTRLFKRTYNQAALLAKEIASLKGWTYAPMLLERKKKTPSQGFLSKEERLKNVKGAFYVSKSAQEHLKGRTILLIDDVFTSGATLNACSHTLLKAGALEIHALTLSRVVKP